MKFHKLIHHVLITIGLALGIIATGTTVNAKAQQLNPNNTDNNTPSSNQNINNNQIRNSDNVLINVPQQNQANYSNNISSQSASNLSNNNNLNLNSYVASYVQNNENHYYAQTNPYYQSSSQNTSTLSKSNLDSLNNFNPNRFQATPNDASNTANHIYKNILSENEHHFNDNKKINNAAKSSSQSSAKTSHSKIHSLRLSAVSGKSNSRPVQRAIGNHKHWFKDGLSRQNLKARSWVSWHESNHRWRVLSYGGVCVGYFQLSPSYLGYKHGHVNLDKRHQVKVADAYVRGRYGNWINAKRFWETHHWY